MKRGVPIRGEVQSRSRSFRSLLNDAGEITYVQLALDRRWDVATRAIVATGDPVTRLMSAVRPHGECAIELFARDSSGCVTFLGLRFTDISDSEVGRFLNELFALPLSPPTTLWRVAKWISSRLGVSLFTRCRVAEVGVVDAWRSPRLRRIPLHRGNDIPLGTAHAALLSAASRLEAAPGEIIAVEFPVDTPVPHWIATELGRVAMDGTLIPSASAYDAAAAIVDLTRKG